MMDLRSVAWDRVRSRARNARARVSAPFVLFLLVLLGSGVAFAHERFVKHNLRVPLHYEFFGRYPDKPLGIHPDLLMIAIRVFAITAAFLAIWFLRQGLAEFVERKFLRPIGGAIQLTGHKLACFMTDRPVRGKIFHALGEWAVILFTRSAGLVLMYSATNDSLVMPSYPLDPASASIFKFAQVGLAILILTQTALPLCGAMIFGTWLYLFRWGWMVAIDAMPVLTVAVVYISSPWQSHKLAITQINAKQMRWLRIVLGLGFVALGWLKVFNHNLVAGVADNAPSVLNDPMVAMLTGGGGPEYFFRREAWVVAFGLAEVMSGFLVMIGVFTRVWAAIMAFMFTKLMLVDFGWDEIPHIYPIGAMLVVIFSNRLTAETDPIEAVEEVAWREKQHVKRFAIIGGTALIVAGLLIFPLLYIISFIDRSGM
jgi:uncharacterized membrane protein YphA (DoxX/SURF4 family)